MIIIIFPESSSRGSKERKNRGEGNNSLVPALEGLEALLHLLGFP